MPFCDTHAMNEPLAEISRHVARNAHAVLVLDQAGGRMTNNLKVPNNISMIALPPKSPELNPMKNIWQFMRDNWLWNRIFKTYNDIVDVCCHAWRKLVANLWAIISIGLRD